MSPQGDGIDAMLAKFRSREVGGQAHRLLDQASRPEVVFVVAAAAAVYAQDWFNAEQFAELALRTIAEPTGPTAQEKKQETSLELMFIHALTKRFRIGEFEGHFMQPANDDDVIMVRRSLSTITEIYESAKTLLDECVEIHSSEAVEPGGSDHASLY